MKRIIFTFLTFSFFVTYNNAQNQIIQQEGYTYFIPSNITFDGKARLAIHDRHNGFFQIYNSSLINEKEIRYEPFIYTSSLNKERKEIAVLTNTKIETGLYNWTGYKDFVSKVDSSYKTDDGATFYIKEYYNTWKYGKKYPQSGYQRIYDKNYGEEMLNPFYFEYVDKYDGEWQTHSYEYLIYEKYLYLNIDKNLFDDETDTGIDIMLSQTFFNTDEKYEIIRGKYIQREEFKESDRDDDGDTDYIDIYSDYYIKGIDVFSETGENIMSFDFNHEIKCEYLSFIDWDGKRYIMIEDYEKNVKYIYQLDSNTNSLKRVSANSTLMAILPTIARKNTDVTIQLDNVTNVNGGTLIVTETNGRTVYTQCVSPGMNDIRLSTRRLPKGMYIVSFSSQGKTVEASKLIIQ